MVWILSRKVYQTGGWQNRLRRCSVSGTGFLRIALERTATYGRDQWRDPARMFDSLGARATGFWLPLSAAEGAKGQRTGDSDPDENRSHIGKLPQFGLAFPLHRVEARYVANPSPIIEKQQKNDFVGFSTPPWSRETEIARIGGARPEQPLRLGVSLRRLERPQVCTESGRAPRFRGKPGRQSTGAFAAADSESSRFHFG